MLPVERELAALKFLDGLSAHLKDVREPHKALRHALRDTREFFGASHGCIATLHAGRPEADLLFTLPKQADWDLGVLTRYIRHTHPPVQRDMLIGSVRRRGGAWGAIALVAPGPRLRSGGSTPDRAHRRASVSRHSPDRPRSAPRRARSDRPEDHGADPSEGSLLSDPGRHPIADPLRSFVGAAHPRGGRGVAARGGGTDRVDEGEERADRTADSDHRGRGGAAAVGTGLRLRSPRRQLAGVEGSAGRRACGAARLQQRRRRRRREPFAKRRCCARRWSRGTASSAC